MFQKDFTLEKRIEFAKALADRTFKEMKRMMFDDDGEFSIYMTLGINDGIYHCIKDLEAEFANSVYVDDDLYGFLDILLKDYNYDESYIDILQDHDYIKQLIMGHALCYITF